MTDKDFLTKIINLKINIFTFDSNNNVNGINYINAFPHMFTGEIANIKKSIVDNLSNAPAGFSQRMSKARGQY